MSHADIQGKAFQTERKVIEKIPQQECAWHVKEQQVCYNGQSAGSKKRVFGEDRGWRENGQNR